MRDSQEALDYLEYVSDGVYLVDKERRISYWNRAAEKITGFRATEVRGQCCADNILTHVDDKGTQLCREDCPLAQTLKDGRDREALVFLRHKLGHRVPVLIAVRPVRDHSGKVIAAMETFHESPDAAAMRNALDRLKNWGCVDAVSGLLSRRVLDARLQDRFLEMQQLGWPFGVLLVEVDNLGKVQKRLGEQAVAKALRLAGQSIQNALRSHDMVVRWDAAQFLAIVVNVTAEELTTIAQHMRALVKSSYIYVDVDDEPLRVTVSIGAAISDDGIEEDALRKRAQQAVAQSQQAGGDQVNLNRLVVEP